MGHSMPKGKANALYHHHNRPAHVAAFNLKARTGNKSHLHHAIDESLSAADLNQFNVLT